MTDRNELERLLAAATEGPWEYRPDEFDDWGVVKSPPREVGNYEPPLILRTVLAQMRWEANARLVVFLRNNAQHFIALMDENARLREALKPFAFLEMEKDEGLADTQYVWEVIYSDRVRDWFSFNDIDSARAALGASHD